jgi:predicted DNA-binding ribbon-helix-helix protein
VDAGRPERANLSSALRVFVLEETAGRAKQERSRP